MPPSTSRSTEDLAAIREAFTKYAVPHLPRPGVRRRQPARLRAPLRAARDDRLQGAQGPQAATAREAWPTVGNLDAENRILEPATASASTISATGCGTPTPRSSACRPTARCCMPARSRRSAARPSSPTCARPTTPCPRPTRERIAGLRRRALDHDLARQVGLRRLRRGELKTSRRCRRCWCAACRTAAA